MSNLEYHQNFLEAMRKLVGETKDRSTQWEGGEDNCDLEAIIEDVTLDE